MERKLILGFYLLFLIHSVTNGQNCCCGDSLTELYFPGLDFEFPPPPPPGWFTNYPVGPMGPWTITSGTVDHVSFDYPVCVCCGNPNGCSNFIDLFGSPPGNGGGEGTMQYQLTGLIPGTLYKIEFYYATFDKPGNYSANVKVANGAWLNKNWTASNTGNVIWLKASYQFTAQASTANISFTDTGNVIYQGSQNGMLIDDVKIYGCSNVNNDTEAPVIQNPPVNLVVDCIDEVPPAPKLIVTDNCDTSPLVKYTQTIELRPPCKRYIRDWIVTDGCGNSTSAKQIIDIIDNEAPIVHNPPPDITVTCLKDIPPLPKLDITDNCRVFNVLFNSSTQKGIPCRKISREWKIYDGCGTTHETIVTQTIDVVDTEPPVVQNPPADVLVGCEVDTPSIPKLIINDNCDLNPTSKFKEIHEIINPCTKKITRIWTMIDSCDNMSTQTQVIDIIDESPVVNNTPQDVTVACDQDVPAVQILDFSDNCSVKPSVSFKESADITDPCHKRIKREWNITDACGNLSLQTQFIDVIDDNPPQFTKSPENKIVTCDKDVLKEFNAWIKLNGNAIAIDACLTVSWQASYDFLPKLNCDSVLVEFIAKDHCDHQSSQFAYFIVRDTIPPIFITKAASKNYACIKNTKDSLRAWLSSYGYLKMKTDCDTVILSSNFDGDSTKNPMRLTFYAKDRCGNIDSCKASFSYRSNNDTLHNTNYSCNITVNYQDTADYFVNGCDSIVIVQHIKKNPDSIYIQLNTCDINHKQFDTLRFTNQDACDSSLFYEYILKPSPVTKLQIKDCSYQNYWIDTIKLDGQFCDSTVITEHLPLRKDNNTSTVFTCDPTKAGISLLHLTNVFGCDSIVNVYTNYIPNLVTFIDQKICGLIKSYTDTIKYNTGLCDSLVIIAHNALPIDSTQIAQITCDPTKAGIFINSFTNQYGCDSVVIQNIHLNQSDSILISNSTCSLSQAGINIMKFQNKFGCDSIVKTITVFIPSDTARITRMSCDIKDAGIKTEVLKGKQCDSMIITTTTFAPSDTSWITLMSCDISDAKVDTLYYLNKNNCDSIIYRSIVFIHADTSRITRMTCDIKHAGITTKILKGTPCDSVIITTTVFVPSDTSRITRMSCDFADAGSSRMVLKNTGGCDSLILLNTIYVPLHLEYELDSISCYKQDDGIFRILNTSDFDKPFELFLNNKMLGNQDQINNLGPGSYHIFVRDQKGCITDSVDFILMNPGFLLLDLGSDLVVNHGTKIYLNLKSNRNLKSIIWSPANLSSCNNCNQIHLTIDQDTWVYAQAIDERNCTQMDSIFIRVKNSDKVFAPNSFTPNGDNINDYFYIYGPDKAVVENLYIYDRWGEKVFETFNVQANQPTSGWNGSFNSQKMNPGVFVYYAKVRIDKDVIELKGDLTLIR